MEFAIGDLVECVEPGEFKPKLGSLNSACLITPRKTTPLEKGSIYTIRDIRKEHYGDGEFYVYLKEVGEDIDGWYPWRFKKWEEPRLVRRFFYSRMLRFE